MTDETRNFDDVPVADYLEQQAPAQPPEGETELRPVETEANVADVLEQGEVIADEEDYPREDEG